MLLKLTLSKKYVSKHCEAVLSNMSPLFFSLNIGSVNCNGCKKKAKKGTLRNHFHDYLPRKCLCISLVKYLR